MENQPNFDGECNMAEWTSEPTEMSYSIYKDNMVFVYEELGNDDV
jgi:hypothetical protein